MNKALYHTLKRMIERGQTEGMEEKLDIFMAASKITTAEYQELMELLGKVVTKESGIGE